MDEMQLIDRATQQYQRSRRAGGFEPQQPCRYRSEVRGRRVILENVGGVLATYSVGKDGKLTEEVAK